MADERREEMIQAYALPVLLAVSMITNIVLAVKLIDARHELLGSREAYAKERKIP